MAQCGHLWSRLSNLHYQLRVKAQTLGALALVPQLRGSLRAQCHLHGLDGHRLGLTCWVGPSSLRPHRVERRLCEDAEAALLLDPADLHRARHRDPLLLRQDPLLLQEGTLREP